ncbi:MAG: metallophosphoesterase [Syntrophales bacterium]|nr:metallophosphoesterase [Syntrophales bacterium]
MAWLLSGSGHLLSAGSQTPHHLVVLGDPHIPGKFLPEKEAVIRTINSWPDVKLVVAVGDICEDLGTEPEYAAAKQFFGRLAKPWVLIPGNHDFIYEDVKMPDGKRIKGAPSARQKKLARFQKSFGIPAIYQSKLVDNYLLIFLATDDRQSDQLARISPKQLAWLRSVLKSHRKNPTIIFFHAPLYGTLSSFSSYINTKDFIAQPQDELHEILQNNPQVFLWVSGHTHVPATNKDFRSALNYYENRVYTLHNADMNRKTMWTNSLFLFPDKVVIKTYDHRLGAWSPGLEKTLIPPRLLIRGRQLHQ